MIITKHIPSVCLEGKTFTDVQVAFDVTPRVIFEDTPSGVKFIKVFDCEDWQIVALKEVFTCTQEDFELLASHVKPCVKMWVAGLATEVK